jgi:tetratricopeptide (TPR) repeat protein
VGPGIDFRKYFVALTNAAGAGDTAKAESAAAKAIAIATQEKWMYLVATAQMALGAAWFTKQDFEKTLKCYRAATKAVVGAPDEASKKLEVPTRMAEGSVLIAAGKFGEAAAAFQQAAAAAVAVADSPMEVECWRMAGWCHEQNRQPAESWSCGEQSLQAAEKLGPEQRRMTYLPYVGQMLLRLTDKGTNRNRRSDVEHRMRDLLGPNWDTVIVQGAG